VSTAADVFYTQAWISLFYVRMRICFSNFLQLLGITWVLGRLLWSWVDADRNMQSRRTPKPCLGHATALQLIGDFTKKSRQLQCKRGW